MEARQAVTAPAPTAEALLTPTGEPRWDDIDFDLPCARCGYELRLLTQPRCPECGLTFAWLEVLAKRLGHSAHDWLFEAQWGQRPLRSFVTTLWRSLRPRRFWRAIPLAEPVHAAALLLFLFLAWLIVWTTAHAIVLAAGWLVYYVSTTTAAGSRSFDLRILGILLRARAEEYFAALDLRQSAPTRMVMGGWLCFHAVIVLTMLSLRQTLGRCRIRALQLLRLAVYAFCGSTTWVAPVQVVAIVLAAWLEGPARQGKSVAVMLGVPLVGAVLEALWLAIGWRGYLQLPRGWLVAPCAVLVGGLTVMLIGTLWIIVTQG